MTKKAAFFDFDGTIYKNVLNIEFFKYVFLNNKLSYWQLFKRIPKFGFYLILNKFDIYDRVKLNKKIYKDFMGLKKSLFLDNLEDFFKKNVKGKIFMGANELIQKHREEGCKIIVLTSSFNDILEPLKEKLKIDVVLAPIVESKEGIYTGKILKLPIGKLRELTIIDYATKNNIDILSSYAYSDHHSDIPMLKLVGSSGVVNPDSKLRKVAKKRGWKIYNFKQIV